MGLDGLPETFLLRRRLCCEDLNRVGSCRHPRKGHPRQKQQHMQRPRAVSVLVMFKGTGTEVVRAEVRRGPEASATGPST